MLSRLGCDVLFERILLDLEIRYLAAYPPNPDQKVFDRALDYVDESNGARQLYEVSGATQDLEAALAGAAKAVETLVVASPVRAAGLDTLAGLLLGRFLHSGNLADLDQAISTSSAALVEMPSDSPLVPSLLNNIGFAITTRYERSKRPTDIEWAIDALGECVGDQTLPEGRSILWWTNLGNALRLRYHELSRDMEDLNKAIRLFEAVVRETPAHSPNLAVYRQNLANTVIDRMRDSSAPDHGDLDRGIGLLQKAVTEFGGPPTDLPSIYANLGMALMVRNQQNLDQVDHTAAIDAFRTSIKLGTDVRISQAVHASVLWGDWAFERKAWEEAIEPYECARAASEQLFRIQLARAHKEIILRSTREVHVKMAFALARVQRPEDAVVALESGIGRMLSEALEQGRRDLDSLCETRNAEIYDQYRQVAQELAAACGLDSASGRDAAEAGVLASSIGELQADLDRIVGQIGELPGFEGFLRDLTLDDIRSVCDVPLVYVLYTIHGGLALIVRENQGQGVIA